MDKNHNLKPSGMDMSEIYRAAAWLEQDPSPMIFVAKSLPDPGEGLNIRMSGDPSRSVIIVGEKPQEKIISEIMSLDGDFLPDAEIAEGSALYGTSDLNLVIQTAAVMIADILRTTTPQVLAIDGDYASVLSHDMGGVNYSEDNLIVLRSFPDPLLMLRRLAHEMRHHWQKTKKPGKYPKDGYLRLSENGLSEYMLQPAEVDAEAFACRLMMAAFGADCYDRFDDPAVNLAIRERAARVLFDNGKAAALGRALRP